MEETGLRNNAHGADKFGLTGLEAVHWNLGAPRLYEHAVENHEGSIVQGGAFCAETGVHTGRSPKDKFVVCDEATEKTIWWAKNGKLTPAQ
ncbi:MAG TPA: phosphoenolpyruvate carboxykinase (ATP), partial [Xanthobacteraceae bacterium]